MKKNIFTSAFFSFVIVVAFLIIFKPFRIAELSTSAMWAYVLSAGTISMVAVILSIIATWKWLKLSSGKIGYWGRLSIGLMVIPQLIVGLSVLQSVAFNSTTYELLNNLGRLTVVILTITVFVFIFDYCLYRTNKVNERKEYLRKKSLNLCSANAQGGRHNEVKLTDRLTVDLHNIFFAFYDGYYLRVHYVDDDNNQRSKEIHVTIETFLHVHQPNNPELQQCHTKYLVNTSKIIEIKMNWFGKYSLSLKNTTKAIPVAMAFAKNVAID